jgi:hypothetical protein
MTKTQDFLLTLLGLFLLAVLVVVIVVLGIKTQRMQVDMPGGGQISGTVIQEYDFLTFASVDGHTDAVGFLPAFKCSGMGLGMNWFGTHTALFENFKCSIGTGGLQ